MWFFFYYMVFVEYVIDIIEFLIKSMYVDGIFFCFEIKKWRCYKIRIYYYIIFKVICK